MTQIKWNNFHTSEFFILLHLTPMDEETDGYMAGWMGGRMDG